jgi:hypothetical protein
LIANNFRKQLEKNSRFSAQAAILKIFLNVISPSNEWAKHLHAYSYRTEQQFQSESEQ